MRVSIAILLISWISLLNPALGAAKSDLPSWQDRPAKTALLSFISMTTQKNATTFVPRADRFAVFDNDGTLWSEKPTYFQAFFILNRIAELAPRHPEWKTTQPFKSILERDISALSKLSEADIAKLVATTHAGMSEEEFDKEVARFLSNFKHPQTKRRLVDMAYKPMIELISLLQKNGFKVFIVTGGGTEFVRSFSEKIYGVPKENVIGTGLQYEYVDKPTPHIIRKAEIVPPINDGDGKPVHIQREIGGRPILAFGNSDGDFEMLRFTTGKPASYPRLGLILRHDDADREYQYDRDSETGRLDKALKSAKAQGWIVVSMKQDFKSVFAGPHQK